MLSCCRWFECLRRRARRKYDRYLSGEERGERLQPELSTRPRMVRLASRIAATARASDTARWMRTRAAVGNGGGSPSMGAAAADGHRCAQGSRNGALTPRATMLSTAPDREW